MFGGREVTEGNRGRFPSVRSGEARAERERRVPVWDPFVRIFHWTLVASIAAAWLTQEGYGRWHEWIGCASLVLVALHVAGVVFTSLRHRENLVAAMVHGRKRAPESTDVM